MEKFDYILASGLYKTWLDDGNTGSKEDFKAWLSSGSQGLEGIKGVDGVRGPLGEPGKSSYEIVKSANPELIGDFNDYVQKLGKVFLKKDAELSYGMISQDVSGGTTTISVPYSTNLTNAQVNPEDQNNLPKSSPIIVEVWDDAPLNYVIKNIYNLATGVGPFTFVDAGPPLLENGSSLDPAYALSPFELKPNGDIVVKDTARLSTFFNEFSMVNGKTHYYNVKDKYGRISNAGITRNDLRAYILLINVKSASKIVFSAVSYEFDILKNVNNGDWVGTVNASAKSLLPITYSITSDLDILAINSTTGKITIKNKDLITLASGEVPFTVTATNGVKSKSISCRFFLFEPVDVYIINFSISDDGRSILKTENSPVPCRPGENRFLNQRTDVDRNINFATVYTVTKSNAENQNLGIYTGQKFGEFESQTSIHALFPGDVPKNNGYSLSPYDKITEFKVFIGYNFNDAIRAGWLRKPTRINGLEGSDFNVNPTKELVITKAL